MRHTTPRALAVRFAPALVLLAPIVLGSSPAPAATVDVHIINNDFANASRVHLDPTINLGDTIHWLFDQGTHSTTSVSGIAESWNSGLHSQTSPKFTFDHTFTHAGDFAYYCSAHGFDLGTGRATGMAGIIHVTAPPPPLVGDFNNDHAVNAQDLAKWRGDFGVNSEPNADNDADSDGNDMLLWQQNLGKSSAAASALSAIPEPSTLPLLIGAAALLLTSLRQR